MLLAAKEKERGEAYPPLPSPPHTAIFSKMLNPESMKDRDYSSRAGIGIPRNNLFIPRNNYHKNIRFSLCKTQ